MRLLLHKVLQLGVVLCSMTQGKAHRTKQAYPCVESPCLSVMVYKLHMQEHQIVNVDVGILVYSGVAAGTVHVSQVPLVGSALDHASHEGTHP